MAEHMSENNEKVELRMSGCLTVESAGGIRDAMLKSLKTGSDIMLSGQGMETIDVSFIQLVVSLRKTLEAGGRRLEIDSEVREILKKAATDAGLEGIL